MLMWLHRFERQDGTKKVFRWVQVQPIYSCVKTRIVTVFDSERGKYPAGHWNDFRYHNPDTKAKAA